MAAGARRRPQKKRTKKQAGTFPLSGPPPPIGHPIRHPMHHPPMHHPPMRHPLRRPLRRGGLTAGPRPVRPSASAGPCCPAVPPPVSSALPLGREAGKFPIRIFFAVLPNRGFPAFLRGSGESRAGNVQKNAVGRPVCLNRHMRGETAENCEKQRAQRRKYWNGRSKTKRPQTSRSGTPFSGNPPKRGF